ncbi:bifunctional serine/threonine-protein kinase/formylglycine-generating enzyme family protein [Massilia phyllosphaerae]|uniref:bifunctional serine/threonine-protein kinase/formylglycine-generating enzyme family protein n=1 Tax=Massilia phyllosphaerae TaxID=3106034 RepID=UPI002B1CC931|nr:bifunctional serine/threonine-protein kinase/formylglycine-generating enzyme family protein [Massilia sp. SGZ-792]
MQTALDKLRELRALHEDGLLSREEFEGRKNAILDASYAPPAPSSDVLAPAARPGTEIGLMAGQEVGPFERRYRLDRLIAHGGMGQVWEATDLATEAELGHSARVALKILPPQLTENGAHARLLIEEAARARQLAHEHIVRVYDWAQDPATSSYFIIMECLDGEDVDSLLAREGALGLERTLQLLAPAAEALDHAWERHRLVHRDIKPANLFLTRRGEVKLLDFGIAASARGGVDADSAGVEAPPSSGTAGYRAPEAGRDAAAPAPAPALDVYSVAVLVYRMVAGRLPFGLLRDPLQQPTHPAGLNEAQWEVLQAGFALDPQARPASVRLLLARLQDAAGPGAAELAEEERQRRDAAQRQAAEAAQEAERKAQQAVREAAIRAAAVAAARAAVERQRREQEKLARAAADEARAARKETLRRQLAERRELEFEKARAEQEEAQRKQAQARAASVYLAEQKRARAEEAAQAQANAGAAGTEVEALEAPIASPASAPAPAPSPAPAGPAAAAATAGPESILRDRFIAADGQGPELVVLPAGRFQMGSPEHERKIAMEAGSQKGWLARELPQHWVGIERPVAMGRYPVLVEEWRDFVRATGWRPSGDVDWNAPGFAQTGRHPVVGVNWFDALRYVQWLSQATGRTYRLPSEAEWEYACRAGTRTAFSCGDTIGPEQANYDGNFTYNGGPRGAYRRGTTPAGMFAPNAWGLHDMHGNVWEWVQDVVHDNYEGAPLDGSAWETGGDPARRILRGGSWLYNPRYLRSALRNGFSAVLSNDIVGFRVVRELA